MLLNTQIFNDPPSTAPTMSTMQLASRLPHYCALRLVSDTKQRVQSCTYTILLEFWYRNKLIVALVHMGTYVAPAMNSSDVLCVTKVDSMTRNTMSDTVMMLIRAAGPVTRKQMMIGRASKRTLRVTTMLRASVRTNGVEDTSTSGSLERFGYLSR
jgi:hypothetical protein